MKRPAFHHGKSGPPQSPPSPLPGCVEDTCCLGRGEHGWRLRRAAHLRVVVLVDKKASEANVVTRASIVVQVIDVIEREPFVLRLQYGGLELLTWLLAALGRCERKREGEHALLFGRDFCLFRLCVARSGSSRRRNKDGTRIVKKIKTIVPI